MGLRFQRRIRIAPGVHLNLSRSGLGVSVGPRGASMSFGPRGAYANVGLPGTGLAVREHLGGGGHPHAAPPARRRSPARPEVAALEAQAAAMNAHDEALERLHLDTPAPDATIAFTPPPFAEPEPPAPAGLPWRPLGLGWILPAWRRRRALSMSRIAADAEHARAGWASRREAHARWAAGLSALFARRVDLSPADAETLLGFHLARLDWPRETLVSFEVREGEVRLDVDLPEIEDMPQTVARAKRRPPEIVHDPLSATRVRERYMRHVHGVGVRLAGETFAWLPSVHTVVVSAYTQRPDPATGRIEDTWIYSVRIARDAWARLDFAHLDRLDPVACLAGFELVRKMTKTGIFRPIEPLVEPDPAHEVDATEMAEPPAPPPSPWTATVAGTGFPATLDVLRAWAKGRRIRRDTPVADANGGSVPARTVPELEGYWPLHPMRTALGWAGVLAIVAIAALVAGCPGVVRPTRAGSEACRGMGTTVVVDLGRHALWLCRAGRTVERHAISIGRGGRGKHRRGDLKTPIGTYPIGVPRASKRFGIFIPIGYPTPRQAAAGYTGGAIGIHGPNRPFAWAGGLNTALDWTAGCVAVGSDAEIGSIARWVRRVRPRQVHILAGRAAR